MTMLRPPRLRIAGRTIEEALANAHEAATLYLDVLRDEGKPIPEDVKTAKIDVAAYE